jgi:hypothetical protein
MAKSADFKIIDQGSVVGIAPTSVEGRIWWSEHVAPSESWAQSGDFIWCDHRPAQSIINGFEEAGLTACEA